MPCENEKSGFLRLRLNNRDGDIHWGCLGIRIAIGFSSRRIQINNSIMPSAIIVHSLFLAELVALAVVVLYLVTKVSREGKALLLILGLLPATLFLTGSYLFIASAQSLSSAKLIALGIFLIPLSVLPISHSFARADTQSLAVYWRIYYAVQSIIIVYLATNKSQVAPRQ